MVLIGYNDILKPPSFFWGIAFNFHYSRDSMHHSLSGIMA
jgi:hypothetical protein